jgi:superfamily II DNA or RNA helicase
MKTISISFNAHVAQIFGELDYKEREVLYQRLTIIDKNKEFQRIQKKYWGDTTIPLFNKINNTFPTGLLGRVVIILEQYGYQITVNNLIPMVDAYDCAYPSNTREYQIEAIEVILNHRRGVVCLPTGTGKTFLAAALISRFPHCKILFVTSSNKALMYQNAEEIEQILGQKVGLLGDGKKQWDRVTVGTINSVESEAKNNPDKFKDIEIVIFDECHTSAGSLRSETVSSVLINTDYRIGLTATDWRESGDQLRLEGVIGPTIHSMSYTDASEGNKFIIKPELYVIRVPEPKIIYPGAKRTKEGLVYQTHNRKPTEDVVYLHGLVNNDERNKLIKQCALYFLESEFNFPGALIIKDIINGHGAGLQKAINDEGYDIPFIHGKTSLDERLKVFSNLSNGLLKLMVCSVGIISVGINIKPLSVYINAGGGASQLNVIQTTGRFVRTAEEANKQRSICIDFWDQENYYLKNQFFKRMNIIKEKYNTGYTVITPSEIPSILKNNN